MMRGSCKQLISSLFAHMCLTPQSPQWVLALCSDTISSANMDHLEKPQSLFWLAYSALAGLCYYDVQSVPAHQVKWPIKSLPVETEEIQVNAELERLSNE